MLQHSIIAHCQSNVSVNQALVPSKVYRRMKFLPPVTFSSFTDVYSGFRVVESYIDGVRVELENGLCEVFLKEKGILKSQNF